jgi:hypothetical protein
MDNLSANQRYKASGSTLPFKQWIEQEDAKSFSAEGNDKTKDGKVVPTDFSTRQSEITIAGISASTFVTVAIVTILIGVALNYYNNKQQAAA